MAVQYKDLTKARKVIAVVMFIFAFFNSAYVQLNTPLLSTMIETQGWTNEMLCNLIVTMGNFAQIPAYLICLALGGTVAQAGMASGMMSLFSCIGRLFFGKIYGKLGRFTIHLDLALLIVGMAIASHSHSYAMALVALAFVGVSMALTAPAALNRCIEISPRCQERAQSITSIGFALGNFGSTYWKLFVGKFGDGTLNSVFRVNSYFTVAVLVIAFGIFAVLISREKKPQ